MELKTIHNRMLENISDEYEKSKGEFIYDETMAAAIEIEKLHSKADEVIDKGFAETTSGRDLERICYEKDVYRHQATFATGTVTINGANGTTINSGQLVASDSAVFGIISSGIITNETINVSVRCIQSGIVGNVPKGAIKSFPKTIAGLKTVTNTENFVNGYDTETDESLRERYYLKVRTPATSGNKYHYKNWAMEVVGVGFADVIPLEKGNGTVTVVIVNSNKQGADAVLIDKVSKHIEENRPIGATVTVESAAELRININVAITFDEQNTTLQEVKINIINNVTEHLKQIAFKENYVSYAKIGNVILNCKGIIDYSNLKINEATSNILIGKKQVAVMGALTIV